MLVRELKELLSDYDDEMVVVSGRDHDYREVDVQAVTAVKRVSGEILEHHDIIPLENDESLVTVLLAS